MLCRFADNGVPRGSMGIVMVFGWAEVEAVGNLVGDFKGYKW